MILKHSDGHILTEKELKFLSLTSQELNRFIDKDLYQKYVDLLSPEFISQLETNISEQIIEDYHKARDILVKEREKFLVKKNKECREQLMRSREEQKRKQSAHKVLALNQRHQQITKKAILEKFFGIMGGRANQDEDPQEEELQNKKKKSMAAQAISSLNEVEGQKKLKASIYGDISESDYYKLKHPSSKILLLSRSFGDENLGKAMVKDQKQHRVASTEAFEIGYGYRLFQNYSSGPHQSNIVEMKKNQKARVRAARIIQKNWRGYKARSTFKKARLMKLEKVDHKLFMPTGKDSTAARQLSVQTKVGSATHLRTRSVNLQGKSAVTIRNTSGKAERISVNSSARSELQTNRPQLLSRQLSTVSIGKKEAVSPVHPTPKKDGNVFVFHPMRVADTPDQHPYDMGLKKSPSMITPFTSLKSPLNQIKEEAYKHRATKLRGFIKKPKFSSAITEETQESFFKSIEDNDYRQLQRLTHAAVKRLVNKKVPNTNFYPVEMAIEHGNLEMLILLVECGFSMSKCPPITEQGLVQQAMDKSAEGGLKRKEVLAYLRTLFGRDKIDETRTKHLEAAKLWFQV